MLPICNICAKTGVLCSVCESKLNENKISELDIELSLELYKIDNEISFERAIDTKNFIVILTNKRDVGKIIGKDGAHIRELSKKFRKQIRVIGTGDLRDTINDFIAPAHIRGINIVYKLDGTKIRRIKVDKKDIEKLRMDVKDIERLITSLTDNPVEINFE